MDKMTRLVRELKEALDKIDRICKWITEEYGIVIPEFILNPAVTSDSDGDLEDTSTFNSKIELVQVLGVNLKSEQYDENDDFSSTLGVVEDHLYSDFDENEYIEKTPTATSKLSSINAIKFQNSCKPCSVLLPPRIDHQPKNENVAQIIPLQLPKIKKVKTKPTIEINKPKLAHHAKSRSLKSKKRPPTEDEKKCALEFYKTATNFLDIKCPVCSVSVKSAENYRHKLKRHYITMHNFDEKELNSLVPLYQTSKHLEPKIKLTDGQKLQILQVLQNYSESQDDGNLLSIVCPVCPNKKFSPDDNDDGQTMGLIYRFNSHLKNIHMFTNHDFTTKSKCKPDRDQKSKSDGQNGFLCTVCGKIFAHSRYLRIHSLRFHSNSKPKFQCDICCTFFQRRGDMNQHMRDTHSTERNFICQVCGAAFKRDRYLNDHLLIHSEDRKYKCLVDNCGQTFKQKQALQNHTKRFHTVGGLDKIYSCDKCSVSFRQKYGLNKHQLAVHENVRPYKCTICPSTFKKISHLKYHINTHSNPKAKKRGINKPKDF